MSCCGNGRATPGPVAVPSTPRAPVVRSGRASAPVDFELVGSGRLLVTGPSTGMVYRFAGRGTRVRVAARDAPFLYAIPALRPVR